MLTQEEYDTARDILTNYVSPGDDQKPVDLEEVHASIQTLLAGMEEARETLSTLGGELGQLRSFASTVCGAVGLLR